MTGGGGIPQEWWEKNHLPHVGLKPQGLELNLQTLRCHHTQNIKHELEHASIKTFSKISKVSQRSLAIYQQKHGQRWGILTCNSGNVSINAIF